MNHSDVVIIGGGIVGLATAYRLTERFPNLKVQVLEKESAVAQHQTSHNSGVLHSGIYYKPGSLKALNCREGKVAMQRFCEEQNIDFDICGKVIVAVDDEEIPRLERIYERGQQNQVVCEMIGPERLKELEPHSAGIRAIHVPEAGIVSYGQVCQRLAAILRDRGGDVATGAKALKIRRNGDSSVVVETTAGEFEAAWAVNCAGLHSDRVTSMSGEPSKVKVVPFRGEYYELKDDWKHLCRNLIYPVPDPAFPFLGVHFTRMIDGSVECGPNAVLAFAREGYRKLDVNPRDLFESLTYKGFLRLAGKHWRMGAGEMWRSLSKAAFVKALQRLMPEIRGEHLVPARSGVRAQAVAPDGSIVDDFLIQQADRVINVANAPSPAATASLNIGRLVVDRLATVLS
ncbi:MAG: L-2-hydroxyglutarate oxidase [Planctomycetales bacterium]|nr:L-2-hydroxyglutarate oxidase [Planctomycetales bacterium]MCA9228247.1 L-2-hydroxyglutarate oxidase [Planctomycetales bacterium]